MQLIAFDGEKAIDCKDQETMINNLKARLDVNTGTHIGLIENDTRYAKNKILIICSVDNVTANELMTTNDDSMDEVNIENATKDEIDVENEVIDGMTNNDDDALDHDEVNNDSLIELVETVLRTRSWPTCFSGDIRLSNFLLSSVVLVELRKSMFLNLFGKYLEIRK